MGDESVGNSTIYNPDNDKRGGGGVEDRPHAPSPPRTADPNAHLNDTMFGDEQPRTYSPTELASLRNVYQQNVVEPSPLSNDDENKAATEEDAENEIDEEIEPYHDDDEDDQDDVRRPEPDLLGGGGTQSFRTTAQSEDDVVLGSKTWDPNNTAKLPKEGNEDFVVIEISSFTLLEDSHVLRRNDIKRLFVSMEFLNYDPEELESPLALPKPAPNVPCYYNFRKS